MGDMGDIFKEHDKAKKEQHAAWYVSNRQTLLESKIPYSDRGEALLFREKGMPQVDFYPSTGRWREIGKRAVSGGAIKFLKWYRK